MHPPWDYPQPAPAPRSWFEVSCASSVGINKHLNRNTWNVHTVKTGSLFSRWPHKPATEKSATRSARRARGWPRRAPRRRPPRRWPAPTGCPSAGRAGARWWPTAAPAPAHKSHFPARSHPCREAVQTRCHIAKRDYGPFRGVSIPSHCLTVPQVQGTMEANRKEPNHRTLCKRKVSEGLFEVQAAQANFNIWLYLCPTFLNRQLNTSQPVYTVIYNNKENIHTILKL